MELERMPPLHKLLKDQVYSDLHQSILSGRYAAGEWLRQDEIARRLGVSMTPVREALDLLVSSGLAERVAYRGVRVLQPSDPDILDAYEMRLFLEAATVQRAATQGSGEDISRMRQLLEEEADAVRSADLPRQRACSRALHGAIAAASGNPLLQRIYLDALRSFPDWMLYEHLYRHPEMIPQSVCQEHGEHVSIVDALAANDAEFAVRKATEHIRRRGSELERYVGISRAALNEREQRVRQLIPLASDEKMESMKERT